MPGSIVVHLTDLECDVLAEMSRELDLPQDRVLVQALRHYQASRHPVPSLSQYDCDHVESFINMDGGFVGCLKCGRAL